MRTSPRETNEPARSNGAALVRLRAIGFSGLARGCMALGCLGLAAALLAVGFVVALFGGSNAGGAIIVALSLATGGVGGWKLLGAVGPRPRLWAYPIQVEAGKTFKVHWEVSRRFKEASSIRITWEGQEVAIERGYDGGIYKSTFSTRLITSDIGPLSGAASIQLPEVMMPSFAARNSRIEWVIRAHVLTDGWPEVEEAYMIEVLPNPSAAVRR